MKYLLLLLLPVNVFGVDFDQNIYAGIGAHSEKYDCPEVCYGGNSLAIVEYTFKIPKYYFAAKALHISNYEIKEKGYGTNAAFIGFYIDF